MADFYKDEKAAQDEARSSSHSSSAKAQIVDVNPYEEPTEIEDPDPGATDEERKALVRSRIGGDECMFDRACSRPRRTRNSCGKLTCG